MPIAERNLQWRCKRDWLPLGRRSGYFRELFAEVFAGFVAKWILAEFLEELAPFVEELPESSLAGFVTDKAVFVFDFDVEAIDRYTRQNHRAMSRQVRLNNRVLLRHEFLPEILFYNGCAPPVVPEPTRVMGRLLCSKRLSKAQKRKLGTIPPTEWLRCNPQCVSADTSDELLDLFCPRLGKTLPFNMEPQK